MSSDERRWGMSAAEWGAAKSSLASLLADVAAARSTVTYGEAARVAFGGRFSARSRALMDLLGDVDSEQEALRGVMIAALVVRKDTGMPGDGFFAFAADELHRDVTDRERFWRAEAEAVWCAYDAGDGE